MPNFVDKAGVQTLVEELVKSTKTINGSSIWGAGNISTSTSAYIEGDYATIKGLQTASRLIPGNVYWIRNYITIPDGTQTIRNGGSPSSSESIIILRANSTNTFDPEGWLAEKISLQVTPRYKILYDIANNSNKYNWSTNDGQGVIYWMYDPIKNLEAPYDFRPNRGLMSAYADTQLQYSFFNCANCKVDPIISHLGINVTAFKFPHVNLTGCQNVYIEGKYDATAETYLNKCIELGNCKNIKIGAGSSDISIFNCSNCSIGAGSSAIHITTSKQSSIHDIYIGSNCNTIDITDAYDVEISNSCSKIRINPEKTDPSYSIKIGMNGTQMTLGWVQAVEIGMYCQNICLANSSNISGGVQLNADITIGANCNGIGLKTGYSASGMLYSNLLFQRVNFHPGVWTVFGSSISTSYRKFIDCDINKSGISISSTLVGMQSYERLKISGAGSSVGNTWPIDYANPTPSDFYEVYYDSEALKWKHKRYDTYLWQDIS